MNKSFTRNRCWEKEALLLKSIPLSCLYFGINCLTLYKGLKYDAYFEVMVQTCNKYTVTSALL